MIAAGNNPISPPNCHPERSLAKSGANRQTESKDLAFACSATAGEGNFRELVRFVGDRNTQ